MLKADTLTTTRPEMMSQLVAKEFTKKKRKSMMEIKKYTGSASKKTKWDTDKFKGWSEEGKAFMVKMTKAIKDDVESGAHEKWESTRKYVRRSITLTRLTKAANLVMTKWIIVSCMPKCNHNI
jgi:hypothetical protein